MAKGNNARKKEVKKPKKAKAPKKQLKHRISGVFCLWRWRELNPRPKKVMYMFLQSIDNLKNLKKLFIRLSK